MKQVLYFLIFTLVLSSCNQDKNNLDDLVVINEKGVQENRGDTLSVEDVLKLESATEGLAYSYASILTSTMEKSYPFTCDSGKTVQCVLTSDGAKAKITLYKEMVRFSKIDSLTKLKIIDYSIIGEGDSLVDFSRKTSKYKAVVRIENMMSGDSTVKFTLNIYKK
jgi:hypothetical protein